LDFTGSSISSLSRADLGAFPKLVSFNIRVNPIISLDGDVFASNPSVIYINFSVNKLRKVERSFFENLRSLQKADFFANPCVSQVASSFAEIRSLNQTIATRCIWNSLKWSSRPSAWNIREVREYFEILCAICINEINKCRIVCLQNSDFFRMMNKTTLKLSHI
jgi:hypothetical protein